MKTLEERVETLEKNMHELRMALDPIIKTSLDLIHLLQNKHEEFEKTRLTLLAIIEKYDSFLDEFDPEKFRVDKP